MAIRLYFDHNVSRAVANGLRRRGVDVITAYEDQTDLWADTNLLDHATRLGRVLVTHDRDFLVEAASRQQRSAEFAGVVFVREQRVATGTMVNDLEIFAKVMEPAETANQIYRLPL